MWVELEIFISDVGRAGVVIIHICGWDYSSKCGRDCRYYLVMWAESCDYFVMWAELEIFMSDVGGAGDVIIHRCGWDYIYIIL